MANQLLTPLRLIAHMNSSLKNCSCELFNLIRTVRKVELISTFSTAACESWNVSDKYTWDNAGDLKQLSMDQNLSEDSRDLKQPDAAASLQANLHSIDVKGRLKSLNGDLLVGHRLTATVSVCLRSLTGVIKRQFFFHIVTHVFDISNLSQEKFAIDTLRAMICSLGHGRKHLLMILPTVWRSGFSRKNRRS